MKNNYFGLIDFCPKILLVFTAGFLARKLGPELYAAWALLLGLQVLIANLSSMGFTTSMQRLLPALGHGTQNYYLVLSIGLNCLLNVCVLIFLWIFKSELIAVYKLKPEIEILIYPLVFISFLTCIETTLDTCIKIREDIKKYQFYIGYRTLCELVTLVYFFKMMDAPSSVELLLLYVLTLSLAKSLGYTFLLAPYFKTITVDHGNVGTYIKYGLPTVIASVVLWAGGNLDKVMLTRYMSFYELGNYSFGASLATYITYLGVLIVPLLLPRLSFLYDTNVEMQQKRVSQYLNQNLTCMILGIGGVWFFLSLFANELVLITAGDKYPTAARTLFFLALYYGIDQIVGLWAYVYHLKKRPYILTTLRLAYFFAFVGGLVLCLRFFDANYLVFGILGMGIIYNVLLYGFAQRLLPITISVKNLVLFFLVLGVSVAIYSFSLELSLYSRGMILLSVGATSCIYIFREYRAIDTLFTKLSCHQ